MRANKHISVRMEKKLTCHARAQVNRHRTYDLYHARHEDCAACPMRSSCLKKASTVCRNLSIQVKSQSPNLIDEMKTKVDSEEGKRIYGWRLGIVEQCFPISVCRSSCTASPYAPNLKSMYNGDYSLCFTILAKSTRLEH